MLGGAIPIMSRNRTKYNGNKMSSQRTCDVDEGLDGEQERVHDELHVRVAIDHPKRAKDAQETEDLDKADEDVRGSKSNGEKKDSHKMER